MEFKDWLKTDIGLDIWKGKYQFNFETFDQFLDRVSNGNESIRKLIADKKFLFGGRILANRGLSKVGRKVTYSNCFVGEPPEDDLSSIFDAAKNMAITYSRGGGEGLDISKLRPSGAIVNNSAKKTSGTVSFTELYGLTTKLIGQNGRRGALMLSIDCSHPDLVDFIGVKEDLDTLTSANISIKASDDFMEAVMNHKKWTLSFTVEATGEKIERVVDARELFTKIAFNNWDMGEPGILFWDTIHDWFLLSEYDDFAFAGVNPCAEQPLPVWGSCLLGSLNLSEFVTNPFTDKAYFNYEVFRIAVEDAVQGMHEVFMEGIEFLPLEQQRETARQYRQIGLGVMGYADMLIKMSERFGSDESIVFAQKIGKTMINAALQKSALIASVDGVFPKYREKEILSSAFFQENATKKTVEIVKTYGLAHSQLLTCAPTGSISTMLGISGGMEPIIMYSYDRKTESLHGKDVTYKIYTPIVKEYMKNTDIEKEEDLPDFFTNAMELKAVERIMVQATWQKYIDASISSTVNIPEETTVEEVVDIYLAAWKNNLKGITVFRSGCRRAAVLSSATEHFIDINNNVHNVATVDKLKWGTTLATSEKLSGFKRKVQTEIGNVHIQAWFEKTGDIREIWLIESSGGAYTDLITALGRMISSALRTGITLQHVAGQLDGISINDENSITSKIAKALLDMQKEYFTKNGLKENAPILKSPPIKIETINNSAGECPICGSPVIFTNGCMNCVSCGYGGCSMPDKEPEKEDSEVTFNVDFISKN